jgi:4-hydroxybenzoate polyprenyltransferase
MLRFAIVINHLAGGVFVLGALLGFAWNVFGEAAPDGSPPLDPLLLTIFLIFGVIFLLTARSLQDLRVRRWLDLRRFLAKRRRLLHREGRAPAPGETDDKPDQS